MRRLTAENVTGEYEDRSATETDRLLDRDPRQPGHLRGRRDHCAPVAGLFEQPLRTCLLEEAGAYLCGVDVAGQHENWRARALCVEHALDQVCVAGTAAGSADREPAGELGLGGRGEGCRLLVVHVHPVETTFLGPTAAPYGVGKRVEAVAAQSEPAGDAGLDEHFDQLVGEGLLLAEHEVSSGAWVPGG